jgi:predicted nuclease of predicted toxin-antitoxin system
VKLFSDQGWDAIHWSDVGPVDAKDQVILKWDRDNGYIVFTHDLDFGTLLAASDVKGPRVIQVRTQNVMPEALGETDVNAIKKFKNELDAGSLISIDQRQARARILPLRR